MRTTREVLEDHLGLRSKHALGADVDRNYADDLIVLAKDGVFHGKEGIRRTAKILHDNLPEATYRYDTLVIADNCGLLGWSATARDGTRSCHGADSFVVEDGLIRVQTIHFEVQRQDRP